MLHTRLFFQLSSSQVWIARPTYRALEMRRSTKSVSAGSAIIGKLIERPMLHLRDRLFPSRTTAIDPLPSPKMAANQEDLIAPGAMLNSRSSRVGHDEVLNNSKNL